MPLRSTPIPTVLVTGGTGFVGSAIVRSLLEHHPTCQITILDLTISPSQSLERGISHHNVTFLKANILDLDELRQAFQSNRPTAVVHTAGFVPPLSERYARRMEREAHRLNVDGTRNVLEVAREVGVKAFVYTSTCCVVIDDWRNEYANIDERWPVVERGKGSIYAESKAIAEMMVLKANGSKAPISENDEEHNDKINNTINSQHDEDKHPGMLTSSIRPAVIYGEGDHQLVPSIVSCIIDKHHESPFVIGPATNLWDTVYVGNVADAHVLALENLLSPHPTASGEAFFIQNNTPTTFREFCLIVWKTYNGHIPAFTVRIPTWLAWGVGAVMEGVTWWTGSPATLSRGSINDATAVRYASGEKARRVLGYEPRVGMEEGLRRSCEEYKRRREREGAHPRSNTEVLVEGLMKMVPGT